MYIICYFFNAHVCNDEEHWISMQPQTVWADCFLHKMTRTQNFFYNNRMGSRAAELHDQDCQRDNINVTYMNVVSKSRTYLKLFCFNVIRLNISLIHYRTRPLTITDYLSAKSVIVCWTQTPLSEHIASSSRVP